MKKYDLAVKVGTKADGKGIYRNVGVVLQGDKGPYILLDKTFNPAGVNTEKQSIIISMFEPKQNDSDNGPGGSDIPF